jgi:hypothetical protein
MEAGDMTMIPTPILSHSTPGPIPAPLDLLTSKYDLRTANAQGNSLATILLTCLALVPTTRNETGNDNRPLLI